MTPLAPAVFELRMIGLSIAACGGVGLLAVGDPAPETSAPGPRAWRASLIVLWVLGGARAARRAARLALPVAPRWRLEGTAVTLLRVLVARTLPAAALAVGGRRRRRAVRRGDGRGGVGGAARRRGVRPARGRARPVRGAVRGGGACSTRRRLLRPLGRNSLFLEPAALADRPDGRPAPAPWPSHRPPQRTPRAAIELEPANGAAFHGAGVRPRPPGRVSAGAAPDPPGPAAGG